MTITMTNKADSTISVTYLIVTNCAVRSYADLNFKPHWVLELPIVPGDNFPTATFDCAEWNIEVSAE